jgi:hypothetical protein
MRVLKARLSALTSSSLRLFVVVSRRTGGCRFTWLCFKLGHNFMHFANCLVWDYSIFHGCVLIIVDVLAHARALLICIIWIIWWIFLWTRRLLDDFIDDLKLCLAGLFKLAFFEIDEVLQKTVVTKLVSVDVFLLSAAAGWRVHNVEFLYEQPG